MRLSNVVFAFAMVLAVAATGCKYDKAGKGAGGADEFSDGQDISSSQGADEGSLSSVTEGKFEFATVIPTPTPTQATPQAAVNRYAASFVFKFFI